MYEFSLNGDEYLFYDHEELQRQNSYEFGKEDGIEQTRREAIFNMLGDGLNSITIAEYLDIKVEDVEKIVSE